VYATPTPVEAEPAYGAQEAVVPPGALYVVAADGAQMAEAGPGYSMTSVPLTSAKA
jgi:hypothetical protein